MLVQLDRIDLLNLVHFVSPNFKEQQTKSMLDLGRYSNVFNRWIWNDSINNMTNEELYSLYQKCKKRN